MNKKTKILYLNYYTIPKIKSGKDKINKFGFSYSFLAHLGTGFEIIVFDCIGANDDFKNGNVQYIFRRKKSNSRLKYPKKLNKEIIKLNPDVILLQGFRFIHFADVLKKKLPNTRLIVQHHAEQIPSSKLKQKILQKFSARAEAYIFSSRELAKPWMDSGIIASNAPIIELPEIAACFKMGVGAKVPNSFIWVGRLNDNKDPLTVIKGVAFYFKANKDATLRMYYHIATLKDQIQILIKELGIETQVTLVGEVPNAQLEIEYQKSQFFLLGSHYEGGSLALMESLSCGCVPIVSDIPANRKFTDEGKLGVLFEAGNSQSLTEKLDKIDALKSEVHTKKVRAYFEEKLSAEAIAKGVSKYLNN